MEFAAGGFVQRALHTLDLAEQALLRTTVGRVAIGPLIQAQRVAIGAGAGHADEALLAARQLENSDPKWRLPSRPEDIAALHSVIVLIESLQLREPCDNPGDQTVRDAQSAPALPNTSLARYLLGCWYLHCETDLRKRSTGISHRRQ